MRYDTKAPINTKPTMVMVWAPTCPDCRAMKPALEEASKAFENRVDLIWIDGSQSPHEAGALRAMATPTLIGFHGGHEVFRHVGRRTAGEIRNLFGSLATGADAGSIGRKDGVLRGLTAAVLIGLGLAIGPAWPMVAIGGVVASWVVVDEVRRRR